MLPLVLALPLKSGRYRRSHDCASRMFASLFAMSCVAVSSVPSSEPKSSSSDMLEAGVTSFSDGSNASKGLSTALAGTVIVVLREIKIYLN